MKVKELRTDFWWALLGPCPICSGAQADHLLHTVASLALDYDWTFEKYDRVRRAIQQCDWQQAIKVREFDIDEAVLSFLLLRCGENSEGTMFEVLLTGSMGNPEKRSEQRVPADDLRRLISLLPPDESHVLPSPVGAF